MIPAMLLIWLALLLAGETPIGRTMQRWLVAQPARWLMRFTRGQWLWLGVSLVMVALLFCLLEEEGVRLFSLYSPELLGLLGSVEFTSAIDVVAVAFATAASVRLRTLTAWLQARLPSRHRRTRRVTRVRREPANDDGARPAPALAA